MCGPLWRACCYGAGRHGAKRGGSGAGGPGCLVRCRGQRGRPAVAGGAGAAGRPDAADLRGVPGQGRRRVPSAGACRERRRAMIFTRGLKVCLAAQPVDLRRSFEGLALLVRGALREDERSSQIFVFTNRRKDRVRLLYWDGTGLWLMTKKLESGVFAWPKVPDGAAKIQLRAEALEMLLSGIDLKGARLRPWYEDPSASPPRA